MPQEYIKNLKKPVKSLSFEQASEELEGIVKQLENGNIEISSAIDFYSRGVELKKHCEQILNQAKLEVGKIISQDGNAVAITSDENDI
jgi:exodeoxyribonuclease VII small subunit